MTFQSGSCSDKGKKKKSLDLLNYLKLMIDWLDVIIFQSAILFKFPAFSRETNREKKKDKTFGLQF
jgi:hypothetical protein